MDAHNKKLAIEGRKKFEKLRKKKPTTNGTSHEVNNNTKNVPSTDQNNAQEVKPVAPPVAESNGSKPSNGETVKSVVESNFVSNAYQSSPSTLPSSLNNMHLLPSFNDSIRKIKILEDTNKVLHNEKQGLVSRLHEFEIEMGKIKAQNLDLQNKLKKSEEEKQKQIEMKTELQKTIENMQADMGNETTKITNLNNQIKKLNEDLQLQRDKYNSDTRTLQRQIFTLQSNFETLEKEKTNFEKDKSRLSKEKTDIATQMIKLQQTIDQLTTDKEHLQAKLDAEKNKANFLETQVIPLQKRLNEKESSLQQITTTRIKETEERSKHTKKIEIDNQSLLEERQKLLERLRNSDEQATGKYEVYKQELGQLNLQIQSQLKAIERLMTQKRNVMFQLSNEVKRNGLLVKENSELKEEIKLQRQILFTDNRIPPLNAKPYQAPEKSPSPNSLPNQIHPKLEQYDGRLMDEKITVTDSGGWLSGLPLVGRFLGGKQKTFKKTFEVIV